MSTDYKDLSKDQLVSRVMTLEHELAQLKRMIFGASKERFVPSHSAGQLLLELEAELQAAQGATTRTISYTKENRTTPAVAASRSPLPDSLPRIETIIEPLEDTTGLKKIGEQVTEELDYKPGSLFVNRYIRPKYAKADQGGIAIGLLPSRPIEKGIPGPGLLAQIIVDKFCDHIPVYRQQKRFEREGIRLASSTIGDWLEDSCQLLEPLYERLRRQVLSSDYLQVDETPIPVLDEGNKGHTHKGYHWVYYSPLSKLVLFDYRQGRGREGPKALLEDFKGYLQTDGYVAYEAFDNSKDITTMGCMAHARRYFEKALDNDRPRAEHFLKQLQQLYGLERKARVEALTPQAIYDLRQQQAKPILEGLQGWLTDNYVQVAARSPKSAIGQALAYTLPRWEKLCAYLGDGRLQIDNNLVENQIRPVAIGRKNYLFAGSHQGAARAAMLYSLLGSCKAHEINPFQYLRDLFSRLPQYPINKIEQLLPGNWKEQTS